MVTEIEIVLNNGAIFMAIPTLLFCAHLLYIASIIFLHFEIVNYKIQGQCYDGYRVKGGVAVKIQQTEKKAVFTHCYLSINDTINRSSDLKD